MTKWDSMPTAKARQMLIDGCERRAISCETGLTMQSIRSIASRMRKNGVELPSAQVRYEYTGINGHGQVVKFRSLQEGLVMGFRGELVSMCVTGKKKRYAGYEWSREVIQ